jgi:hypothetical protein
MRYTAKLVPAFVVVGALASVSTAHAQGRFGGGISIPSIPVPPTTPWQGRPSDWLSRGPVLFPGRGDSGSTLAVDSPGMIGSNGLVYGPTSRAVPPQTWRAAVTYNPQGRAFYYDPRGMVRGTVPAPGFNRPVAAATPRPAPRPARDSQNEMPLGATAGTHYENRGGRWVLVRDR